MIKHFCDICKKEVLNEEQKYTHTTKEYARYKVECITTSLPNGKSIELCRECILNAIKGE